MLSESREWFNYHLQSTLKFRWRTPTLTIREFKQQQWQQQWRSQKCNASNNQNSNYACTSCLLVHLFAITKRLNNIKLFNVMFIEEINT